MLRSRVIAYLECHCIAFSEQCEAKLVHAWSVATLLSTSGLITNSIWCYL